MNTLAYTNIFDYFSFVSGINEHVIREKLRTTNADEVLELVNRSCKHFSLDNPVLAAPLTSSNGKILILKSSRYLRNYYSTLLSLHKADETFSTSRIVIVDARDTMKNSAQYLAGKLTDRVLFVAENSRVFGKAVESWSDSSDFKGLLNTFFERIMGSFGGMRDGLKLMRKFEEDPELIEDTACMLVAAAKISENLKSLGVASISFSVHKFLLSALTFYPALKLGADHFPALEPSDDVKKVIKYYKNKYGVDEAMFAKEKGLSAGVRFISAYHIFVKLLEKNRFASSSHTAHRYMRYIAETGYTDARAVSWLGMLFAPELSSGLMDYAARIQGLCKQKPILWGASGDKLPFKMYCSHKHCGHAVGCKVYVADDVFVSADREYRTNIRQGEYRLCSKLTGQLENYQRMSS